MTEPKHYTPEGTSMIDSLAEESLGALSIDTRWFELPAEEQLIPEGDAVVADLLMYGQLGTKEKRVRVRLSIESVEDWTDQ